LSNTQYNIYWNTNYTASEYAFDTTRKSGHIAEAISAGGAEVALVDPDAFTDRATELIRSVHDPEYVAAVTTGSPDGWQCPRASTGIPGSRPWQSPIQPAWWPGHRVLSEPGRVAGSLSSGLHHARADRGNGFCTFNGLVVATRAAFDLEPNGSSSLTSTPTVAGGRGR